MRRIFTVKFSIVNAVIMIAARPVQFYVILLSRYLSFLKAIRSLILSLFNNRISVCRMTIMNLKRIFKSLFKVAVLVV